MRTMLWWMNSMYFGTLHIDFCFDLSANSGCIFPQCLRNLISGFVVINDGPSSLLSIAG